MIFRLTLLLLVAKTTLGAPEPGTETLAKKCQSIGQLNDGFSLTTDTHRLRRRVWPDILSCASFVDSQVQAKSASLSDPTREAFDDFVGHVKSTRQVTSDKSECFVKSAAALLPRLTTSQSEADINTVMDSFCGQVVATFADHIPFYSVMLALIDTDDKQPLKEGTADTLHAAKLCHLYQQGHVWPLDIKLNILEASAHEPAKRDHWSKLAAIFKDLFSVDQKLMSSDEIAKLIEQAYQMLLLEDDTADLKPTLVKLKQLREAARVSDQSCLVDRLANLVDLIHFYSDNKQLRIKAYLSELYQKQVSYCKENDKDSDDVKNLKARLDSLEDGLFSRSTLVDNLRDQIRANEQNIGTLTDEFEQKSEALQQMRCADDVKSVYLSQLADDLAQKCSLDVEQAVEKGKQCVLPEVSRLTSELETQNAEKDQLTCKLQVANEEIAELKCKLDTINEFARKHEQELKQACQFLQDETKRNRQTAEIKHGAELDRLNEDLETRDQLISKLKDDLAAKSSAFDQFKQNCLDKIEQERVETKRWLVKRLEEAFHKLVDALPAETRQQLEELRSLTRLPNQPAIGYPPEKNDLNAAVEWYIAKHPGETIMSDKFADKLDILDRRLFNNSYLEKTQATLNAVASSIIEEVVNAGLNPETDISDKTKSWLINSKLLDLMVETNFHLKALKHERQHFHLRLD